MGYRRVIGRLAMALIVAVLWLTVGRYVSRTYMAMRHVSHGQFAIRYGDGPNAAAIFDRATVLRPDLGEISYLAARAYTMIGDRGRAIAALERAKRNYQDFNLFLLLGQLYEVEGQLDQAIAEYDRGLGFAPVNPGLRESKARVLGAHGVAALRSWRPGQNRQALDRAVARLNEAAHLRPEEPAYYVLLGQALLLQGEKGRGETALLRGLTAKVNSIDGLLGLIGVYAEDQRWELVVRVAPLALGALLDDPERLSVALGEIERLSAKAPPPYDRELTALGGRLPSPERLRRLGMFEPRLLVAAEAESP